MFRQYLLFSWTFSFGFIRYFRFEVSLFGLSSALYSFTKLLQLLVKKWRTEGKSIVVYLDYSLGSAANYIEAKITSLAVHVDLLKFGLLKLNSVRGNNPSPELVRFRELLELRISWVPCRFTVFSSVYRLPRGTDCCRLHR